MIRKKLSTQKSKSESQSAIAYIVKKSILIESNRPQIGTSQEFVESMAKRFEKACQGKQQNRSFHEMTSFSPQDNISPDKALEIVKELYEKTHKLNREHVFAVHNDNGNIHVHFIWAPRDHSKRIYYEKDDYKSIEAALRALEVKYHLTRVLKVKSLVQTLPRHSKNEKILAYRGVKTHKDEFKRGIETAFSNLLPFKNTTTQFLYNLYHDGFDIIPNGKHSFSLQKEGQTFKASDLGIQYKNLVSRLDEQVSFAGLMQHYSAKPRRYDGSLFMFTTEDNHFLTAVKHQTVLHKKFTHCLNENDVECFYKNTNQSKAFEYYQDPSCVTFMDLSRDTLKAGIQRLITDMDSPGKLHVSGPEFAKKKLWVEFQMMNLEAKGYVMSGYEPTSADLLEVEKRKKEYLVAFPRVKKFSDSLHIPRIVALPEEPEPVSNIVPKMPETPVKELIDTEIDYKAQLAELKKNKSIEANHIDVEVSRRQKIKI